MAIEPPGGGMVVVAEMNTHHFMFRGAGQTREDARSALLRAWTLHRNELLARYPERADSIPQADKMEDHFRIDYLEFEVGAGYRDGDRLL
ncbi:MAG: hypothetical protein PHE55_07475 [Methylococcaceae bacterium]|nr:hypothetical protein [Methylococcaceae bacterium]